MSLIVYQKAKKAVKVGKSFGEDGVPPEVIKRCNIDDIIVDSCIKALINAKRPSQWSLIYQTWSQVYPSTIIWKLSATSSERGISLSSLVAKTFNGMLLNRIMPHLHDKLRPSQCGFRENSSTIEQIIARIIILQGIPEKNLSAIVTLIMSSTSRRAKVTTPDGETDQVAGGLQGDSVEPVFCLHHSWLLLEISHWGERGRPEHHALRLCWWYCTAIG